MTTSQHHARAGTKSGNAAGKAEDQEPPNDPPRRSLAPGRSFTGGTSPRNPILVIQRMSAVKSPSALGLVRGTPTFLSVMASSKMQDRVAISSPAQKQQGACPKRDDDSRFGNGREQKRMGLAGNPALTDDLASGVDAVGRNERPTGLRVDQVIQVNHVAAGIEKGMLSDVSVDAGIAHDLTAGIDRVCVAPVSSQRTQVDHLSIRIEVRMPGAVVDDVRIADHLSTIIDGAGTGEVTTESAQVG